MTPGQAAYESFQKSLGTTHVRTDITTKGMTPNGDGTFRTEWVNLPGWVREAWERAAEAARST